jgi:hypothetical protein
MGHPLPEVYHAVSGRRCTFFGIIMKKVPVSVLDFEKSEKKRDKRIIKQV